MGTWPVGAAGLARDCSMLHIAAYPACMQGELELLLPAERTAVDALVDKWSQTTGEMYLTRFMRVCESEWDLLAAGLLDILPHPQTCNMLPRVASKPRHLLLAMAEHVRFVG